MISQRFVSTNPQANLGVSGLARVPQQARAIPRTSGVALVTTDHAPWISGATFPSGSSEEDGGTLTVSKAVTNHPSPPPLQRLIYHPGFDTPIVYPTNPDRTINYYRSAVRKHSINTSKTLSGNITIRDPQAWDDVIISEIWEGGGKRLSALAEFFDMLHLTTMTEPALGRSVGWIPKDLSFQRHMIQPLSVTLGGSEADAREMRERFSTSMDSYLDKKIVFTFKFLRPMPFIDSLLVMEGR